MPFCYQVSALHKLLALHGLSYCLESVCPRAEVLNFSEVRPTNDFMHRVPLVLSFLLWSGRCSLLCDFRGETQETGPVAATGSEVVTLPADGGLAGAGAGGCGVPSARTRGGSTGREQREAGTWIKQRGKEPGLAESEILHEARVHRCALQCQLARSVWAQPLPREQDHGRICARWSISGFSLSGVKLGAAGPRFGPPFSRLSGEELGRRFL